MPAGKGPVQTHGQSASRTPPVPEEEIPRADRTYYVTVTYGIYTYMYVFVGAYLYGVFLKRICIISLDCLILKPPVTCGYLNFILNKLE